MRPLGIIAAIMLSACAARAQAPRDVLELRYGETASPLQSIFSLPILVAERQGFFVRHGLHFSIVPVQGGGEATIDMLHEGRADISHVATNFLATAVMKGSDAVAIAAEFNNPVYSLVAKPWVKDFADLRGKLLGMADMTGTVSLSTLALMAKHGLTREDVRIKVIEGTPARFACLIKDDCVAVPLGQPQDFFAKRQGFKIIGLSTEAVPDYLYTVTATRRSWASANKEAVTRYVKALADAFRHIRDPANRDAVARTIQDAWGSSDSSARETLALYFEPERNVLPMAGEINMRGVEQVLKFQREAGIFDGRKEPSAESLVDLDYLRAAGVMRR